MRDHFVNFRQQLRRQLKIRLLHQFTRDRLLGWDGSYRHWHRGRQLTLDFGLWTLDFCFHRSHSPITKSKEPKIATTSLTMCPGSSFGKMLKFTNEGARIFSRCGVPPPLL